MNRLMDRKAVSPVIATILLIVVTVVVAGILGVFVYSQSQKVESKPSAALIARDQPNTSNTIVMKHNGGDALDWADLRISCTKGADSATNYQDPTSGTQTILATPADSADEFVAGESVIIDAESNGDSLVEDEVYHVVLRHEPTNVVLLDANVLVTSA